MQTPLGLVDCNNFYASCERAFDPSIEGKPVVVLSNNDGCIIARSEEAKALGIPMGAPHFKWRDFLAQHRVHVCSSNYPLYGDMSNRVMTLLRWNAPEVEVYSIDEAFLRFRPNRWQSAVERARVLRQTVRRGTGIPVSVGIGPTKTLAKLANRLAKRHGECDGVLELGMGTTVDAYLEAVDVGDVWGIGRRYAERLKARGVRTALELRDADPGWMKRHFTIGGFRTLMELRGVPMVEFDDAPVSRKSVSCSRSFGVPVERLADLEAALATFISRAAEKLRAQRSACTCVHVFVMTSRFHSGNVHVVGNQTMALRQPTAATPVLLRVCLRCVRDIYRPGVRFKKAGITLSGLVPASHATRQLDLFTPPEERRLGVLMSTVDGINRRWGANTVRFAAMGFGGRWQMNQAWRSPAFTTRWEELPVVRA